MEGRSTKSSEAEVRRVAGASLIGTAIEWYDFFIYGAAAALVFSDTFFPELSPLAGTLAAFSTFAVGFLARPLGGIVMGHFGDRVGRKSVLVVSLLTMGLATFAIGLLPSYEAIGVFAPLLLVVLRFVQGLGVGGEWGGAVLMAVEHAPPHKRGFYGSFPQMGVPIGIILSNIVFLALTSIMPEEQFAAWGWRIPFLLSMLLVAVGLFVRMRVAESPLFAEVKRNDTKAKMPILDVLKHQRKPVLLAAGTFVANNAIGYLFIVYTLSYGTDVLEMSRPTVLTIVLAAAAVWLVTLPYFSALSDRLGRRKVFIGGSLLVGAWSFVFFPLLDTGAIPLFVLAVVVMAIGLSATYGPQAALFAELFATRVRYSGASLGYQFGSIFGGGLAPFIATWLYGTTGTSLSITAYMVLVALISLGSILLLRETFKDDLADVAAGPGGEPSTSPMPRSA